jgi:predicted dehydrogenase
MQKTNNVAVIGCGYWGPNLIRNFRSLPECNLVAVCDMKQERLSHMRNVYAGIRVTSDFKEVIEDPEIDAIAVATPVYSHFDLASQSLQAGKHTFIEKPMASSSAECRELVELAANNNLTLMVGHTFVYSTPVRKIKEIVDYGDIGELLYVTSQRLNLGLFQKDINVAWDLAPHDVSIILFVMGHAPSSVNCQGKAHMRSGVEGVTNMSLNFSNGGFATVQSSWLDPNKVRRMTFVGSKRMILYDDNEPLEKIKIYDKRVEVPPHYDTFAEFQYSYHYGDMYAPYLNSVEPLKVQCQHFLDCIKTGEKPLSSGIEGLQVVQVLEAASESLRKGGAMVDIDYASKVKQEGTRKAKLRRATKYSTSTPETGAPIELGLLAK